MTELHVFEDRAGMAGAAAALAARRLTDQARASGRAALSLCGGATPAETYRALSSMDAPWERITITLSDERWLDPASEHSNERLARDTLLRNKAANARFVGLKTAEAHAAQSVGLIDRALAAAPRPIDVGILGLAEDGHTASLFPDAPAAALDRDTQARVTAVPRAGPGGSLERVTMTLCELAAHRQLIFLAHGPAKRAIIDSVIGMGESPQDLPVARVLAAATGEIDIFWAP